MNTFVLVVVVLAIAGGITYFLMKKGKIADANKNNIPDVIDEKVKETKIRVKRVVEEANDLVAAVKAVGKQASHMVDAANILGARKGRKPATKKAPKKPTGDIIPKKPTEDIILKEPPGDGIDAAANLENQRMNKDY